MSRILISYMSVIFGDTCKDLNYADWLKNTYQYETQLSAFKSRQLIPETLEVSEDYSPNSEISAPIPPLVIEWLTGRQTKYKKMASLINTINESIEYKGKTTLCIYDLSAIGYNVEIVKRIYNSLIDNNIPLYILDMSTKDGISKYSTAATNKDFKKDFEPEKYKKLIDNITENDIWKWQGRSNSTPYKQSFFDAFFLHQTYTIGDKEALLLSSMSTNTFPKKWKELDFNPYSPILSYYSTEESYASGQILHMTFEEVEEKWFARNGAYINMTIEEYRKLPRRVGLIPDVVKQYQLALVEQPINPAISTERHLSIDQLKRLVQMDITLDMIMEMKNKYGLPLILPETLKKYCLREIAAYEKKYRSYMSSRIDNHLCQLILDSYQNKEYPQIDHDLFMFIANPDK